MTGRQELLRQMSSHGKDSQEAESLKATVFCTLAAHSCGKWKAKKYIPYLLALE